MQKDAHMTPNRPTGPRHRRINTWAHQADTRRKAVARGASRTIGSVEPALAPVLVHFGGKAVLILLKAVLSVSMYSFGGNQPQGTI